MINTDINLDMLMRDMGMDDVPIVKDGDAALLNKVIDWVLLKEYQKPSVYPDKVLKVLNRGKKGPITQSFRSSDVAAEPCKRYMVMKTIYPTKGKGIDARAAAVFDDGDERHDRIKRWVTWIKKHRSDAIDIHGFEYGWINPELRHTGHLDILVTFLVSELKRLGPVVLELKGIKLEKFVQLKCPTRPHYLQAQQYMHRTGAKWAFVVYENKNTQDRKTYKIAYSEKENKKIDERLKWMNKFVDRLALRHETPKKGDLPPQEIQQWCNRCSQKILCFDLAERGI